MLRDERTAQLSRVRVCLEIGRGMWDMAYNVIAAEEGFRTRDVLDMEAVNERL